MHIVVPLKQSPDLVEEVEINAEGNDIDRDGVSLRLSEWDDQALEEALLLKDGSGGNVTAVTLDGGEADSVLFTAPANGPAGADGDAGIKIRRVFKPESTGHAEMIQGEAAEIAAKLVTILKDRGLGR